MVGNCFAAAQCAAHHSAQGTGARAATTCCPEPSQHPSLPSRGRRHPGKFYTDYKLPLPRAKVQRVTSLKHCQQHIDWPVSGTTGTAVMRLRCHSPPDALMQLYPPGDAVKKPNWTSPVVIAPLEAHTPLLLLAKRVMGQSNWRLPPCSSPTLALAYTLTKQQV